MSIERLLAQLTAGERAHGETIAQLHAVTLERITRQIPAAQAVKDRFGGGHLGGDSAAISPSGMSSRVFTPCEGLQQRHLANRAGAAVGWVQQQGQPRYQLTILGLVTLKS